MKITVIIASLWCISAVSLAQDNAHNIGDVQLHPGAQLAFYGDLTNDGTLQGTPTSTVYAVGGQGQLINGTNAIDAHNFVLDNTQDVTLENVLNIAGEFSFENGIMHTNRANANSEFVHFLDSSFYANSGEYNFIDGVVRKTGNSAFVFPVGEDDLQTVAMSAPANATDHYTAWYNRYDASTDGYDITQKEDGINELNNCEFWHLNRTGGNSNVTPTLEWDNNSCDIVDENTAKVAQWSAGEWISLSASQTTGSAFNGTVTAEKELLQAENVLTHSSALVEPVIAQIFSPNGDDKNSTFMIANIDDYESLGVTIFNRWGTEVYQAESYQNTWDGTSQSAFNIGNTELPEGSYFYVVEADGQVFKGYVYLKR